MTLDQEKLTETIKRNAPKLQGHLSFADAALLLGAIAEIETKYLELNVPKHEAAYDWHGKYFDFNLWQLHGSLAACSYGPWQIMFPVAVELGFNCNIQPYSLTEPVNSIHWVIEYIVRRALKKGADNIEKVFDAYNSGSCRDEIIPIHYIERGVEAYYSVGEKYNLKPKEI